MRFYLTYLFIFISFCNSIVYYEYFIDNDFLEQFKDSISDISYISDYLENNIVRFDLDSMVLNRFNELKQKGYSLYLLFQSNEFINPNLEKIDQDNKNILKNFIKHVDKLIYEMVDKEVNDFINF